MKVGYLVVKWSSPWYHATVKSITDADHPFDFLVIDNYEFRYPLAKAWNIGIESLLGEGCDAVTVVNDDAIVRPWTGRVNATLLRDRDDLLVVSGRHTPIDVPDDEYDLNLGTRCDFACFTISRKALDLVGLFDENFDPGYYEDNDYDWRVKLAGGSSGSYGPMFHYHNGTIKSDSKQAEVVRQRFPILTDYYVAKWGGKPGDEKFTVAFDGGAGYKP